MFLKVVWALSQNTTKTLDKTIPSQLKPGVVAALQVRGRELLAMGSSAVDGAQLKRKKGTVQRIKMPASNTHLARGILSGSMVSSLL